MAHTSPAPSAPAQAARPTDDEILGLTASPAATPADSTAPGPSDLEAAAEEQGTTEQANHPDNDPPEFRAIFESNPELGKAWRDARTFREIFPTVDDARAAVAHSADLAKLDALFFSQDPQSHTQLAQALRSLNPQAYASLAKVMQETAKPEAEASPASFEREHAFFHETNAAAVDGVLQSIQAQLDRLLPEGTPKNTRNRLTGEIYREVDAALQSNRAFGQQLRQAFRTGQLTPENHRAIVGLVVGRAKQILPGIAKKVLGEWTAGVVANAQSRQERQRQAARRVDIAGGHPGGDTPRSLMPKDIDYRRMSDNDILNL